MTTCEKFQFTSEITRGKYEEEMRETPMQMKYDSR